MNLEGSNKFNSLISLKTQQPHGYEDHAGPPALAMDKTNRREKGYDIYLMNYKTRETKQLTDSWKYEQAPVIVKIKSK